MNNHYKGCRSLCMLMVVIATLISACESPAGVGGNLIEGTTLRFDTLTVDNFSTESFEAYTGNLNTFGIGRFEDPVFGTALSLGMIKPRINRVIVPNNGDLNDDYDIFLSLHFTDIIYGDSLSDAEFKLRFIENTWRANEWKQSDNLLLDQNREISSFTYPSDIQSDSVLIPLSAEWRDQLAIYVNNDGAERDSLYYSEFGGLAIEPVGNTNKILFPVISDSRFIIIDNVIPDTVSFTLGSWAYNIEREAPNVPDNSSAMISPLTNVLKFSINDKLEQIKDKNFIKVELILYENRNFVELNTPDTFKRPATSGLNFVLIDNDDPLYELQFQSPELFGLYESEKNLFSFDITSYINNLVFGEEDQYEFSISLLNPNSGIIRSALVYNLQAPPTLTPKIVITYIEDEE